MIVDFEKDPQNSIIYTASIILFFLRDNGGTVDIEELYDYCKKKGMEYSIFVLTIDWLFLIELIEKINDRNEVVLCN